MFFALAYMYTQVRFCLLTPLFLFFRIFLMTLADNQFLDLEAPDRKYWCDEIFSMCKIGENSLYIWKTTLIYSFWFFCIFLNIDKQLIERLKIDKLIFMNTTSKTQMFLFYSMMALYLLWF